METKQLKTIALQCRITELEVMGRPEKWHSLIQWGVQSDTAEETERTALAELAHARSRWPGDTWRLVKTYEVVEIVA